jgi:DNA polymerase III delta prime subunit
MEHPEPLGLSPEEKKAWFKEATITHRLLEQTDRVIMRAIREHGGFAYVLVYGPSGVGKTTVIRQISRRLNGSVPSPRALHYAPPLNGSFTPVPLLVLETRPPDGAAFNRADYYRNALIKLGEPFYEHRRLIDINTEYAGERRTRARGKAAHFNESSELRNSMEEALLRHGVRAVILDEAQHLMTIGNGAYGSSLLDQLEWIKSMTNVTDIVHILVGTYELLSFTRLNGQASRRGLPLHFPRYQLQHEEDCTEFQAALLALLKKVPLHTDAEALVVKHWLYFYERCIGCVGVLSDWLLRAVSATLDEGSDMLTLERLQEHALSISQCEQMALDAVEGEQKLNYTEGRREHLWRLLQGEGILAPVPQLSTSDAATAQTLSSHAESAPQKQEATTVPSPVEQPLQATKKRAGQQAPRRDQVGLQHPAEEKPEKCTFSGAVDLSPAQLATSAIAKLQCPQCGAIWTARIRGETVSFPPHPPRTTTRATQVVLRWIRRGTAWELSGKRA